MVLKRLIERLSPPPADPLARAGIVSGLHHYMRESDGTFTRFHLRVDSSGAGLLLANATAAASLTPSGVLIAKGLLDGRDEQQIVEGLLAAFDGVDAELAAADIARVRRIIATLDSPGDNYPVLNPADPSFTSQVYPFDKPLAADVPLAGLERLLPIVDRLWDLAIPHVTFIAGQRPKPVALVRAVERAEDLGLIAGVRGRASDLAGGSLVEDLAAAGLDHLDLLYLSAAPEAHDALAGEGDHAKAAELFARARDAEVCPVANVALVRSTVPSIDATLERLTAAGVTSAGFFALATATRDEPGEALSADELIQAAELVEDAAEQYDMRCLWYAPARFDPASPPDAQVRRGPRCSGDAAVRIEPDGSVIPARGPFTPAGSLLSDDWNTIREHETYSKYRRRVESDTHCDRCPGLAICAADCPRDPAGWASWG